MYHAILVPTDGSDNALGALDHAFDIARTYGATVHALAVVSTDYPYSDVGGVAVDWGPVIDAAREDCERAVATVEARAADAGVDCIGAVREGETAASEILAYAEGNGIDLIVMGTHVRRGLNRWLLGSVTERVVRTADVPVLTVRAGTTDA